MATAIKKFIELRPLPLPCEVVLTLSFDEAQTLLDITHRIGGSAERTRRKHTDAIRDALARVGIPPSDRRDFPPFNTPCSSIYFEEP
jgi:hypothetical protein